MDHGDPVVVNDEVFDRVGWWGRPLVAPFEESKLVRLGDSSGELLYGMPKVESTEIRDLEWKELVVWGCRVYKSTPQIVIILESKKKNKADSKDTYKK